MQETFSTPETVPFWQLPYFIERAENAGLSAAAFQLQYQKLLSRPFMLATMVLLAAAFSLRFFRFGGVQKMVLGGVATGFLLYVVSKLTDDLSKAELINPIDRGLDARRRSAAWWISSRCCTWRTGDGAFRHHSSAVVLAKCVSGCVVLLATFVAGALERCWRRANGRSC